MTQQESLVLFTKSLEGQFNNSLYSDATIVCNDKKFHVHKVVLCLQSSFFKNAFSERWKESEKSLIDLKEEEAQIVEIMLRFLYQFDYSVGSATGGHTAATITHVKAYAIADKYDIEELKRLSKEKFEVSLKLTWNMDDFPLVISEVYSSIPESDHSLRNILVATVCEHIESLLKKTTFLASLHEIINFAADVTVSALGPGNKNAGSKKYRCPNCHQVFRIGKENEKALRCCINCGGGYNWPNNVVAE